MIVFDAVATLIHDAYSINSNWYIEAGAVLGVLVKSNTNVHIDIFRLQSHIIGMGTENDLKVLYCKWCDLILWVF